MSDIYVVTDGSRVIGASTKMQGAELIRAEYASAARGFWKAHGRRPDEQADEAERETYARVKIQNTELTDAVTMQDCAGSGKPFKPGTLSRDGEVAKCSACGTNRYVRDDGSIEPHQVPVVAVVAEGEDK